MPVLDSKHVLDVAEISRLKLIWSRFGQDLLPELDLAMSPDPANSRVQGLALGQKMKAMPFSQLSQPLISNSWSQ